VVRGSIACPVNALRLWLEAAAITAGPVFRAVKKGSRLGERLSSHGVAAIVKAHAQRVGLDPLVFSGHSLRSGFLTSAAKRGASVFKMMDVSRQSRSTRSVATSVMPSCFRTMRGQGFFDALTVKVFWSATSSGSAIGPLTSLS
jgi:hypothetical protein